MGSLLRALKFNLLKTVNLWSDQWCNWCWFALVFYRQQVWPNQTGPFYIVFPGKRRRWMMRFSTHHAPSSSPSQRTESGQSWCVNWLFTFFVLFFKLNNAVLNWSQLCSLLGSDSFSSDWLHSTNSNAEDLNRFLLCFIREEKKSMLSRPQDGVFYCCFLKFRAATVSLLSKCKHKCQCFDGSDHQNWHDTRN